MASTKSGASGSWLGALAQLVLVTGSSVLLAVIVYITTLTGQAESISEQKGHLSMVLKADVSTTLTLVRALQGLLTTALTVALATTFSYLQWGFVHRSPGMPYLRHLALSPTTSIWGTIRLILHPSPAWKSRLWALFRLLLVLMVWLGGVVLFFRTSLVTVFDTASTYRATAGVGPFNASYIAPFFEGLKARSPGYQFNVLPYSYYGPVHDLVTNSFFTTTADPIACQPGEQDHTAGCAAYLLSGGVVGATPWIPSGYPDHPQVLIEKTPMVHAEFDTLLTSPFDDKTCQVFGSNATNIAARFCLAQLSPTKLAAGMFVCLDGMASCQAASSTPNMTTAFSLYTREGTVLSAKSNLTIIEVSDLTDARPISLEASEFEAYRSVLAWLLDYAAADIPAPSSIVENFWSAGHQLQDAYSNALLQRNFRSILLFPAWLFQANNYGNDGLDERVIDENLPAEFYTAAAVVRSYTKIKFDPVMTFLFVGLEGVVLVFAWAVLGWVVVVYRTLPEISSFPLFDAAFKAETTGHAVWGEIHDGTGLGGGKEVWGYGDGKILEVMGRARVGRRVYA
ncbi:hypothetical protein QBC47DRAFT_88788 [Echria macrotheca]|uniref:Uncharacterized protein n=1 Tax=Echria macrotheca TaxID=438768 RepID=A0AAJ0F298_9PEZI|nr:hypothetical protein QBC47DRAFT_88788 [Echria macrotheca]